MAISLLLPPTLATAIDDIRANTSAHENTWILVPGEAAEATARQHLGHGYTYFQLFSASRELLEQQNQPWQLVEEAFIRRLIIHSIDTLVEQGRLPTFAPVRHKTGLVHEVRAWIREMVTQGIAPEEVLYYRGPNPLQDELGQIYQRYNAYLDDHRRTDVDGMMCRAMEALEQELITLGDTIHVNVVGFDQFTPTQSRFLAQLARHAASFNLYLVWDEQRDPTALALSRLQATRVSIEEIIPFTEIVPFNNATDESALTHLHTTLFELPTPYRDGQGQIAAIAAPSRESEVREALRRVRAAWGAGVPLQEMALLVPNPALYQRVVQAVAKEYAIPLQASIPLVSTPIIATLVALLHLAPDFSRRDTLNALRSPYVQHNLSIEQLDALDRLTRERPVIAGEGQWLTALQPYRRQQAEGEGDDDLGPPPLWQTMDVAAMEALRTQLSDIFRQLTPPSTSDAPQIFGRWLEQVLLGMDTEGQPYAASPSFNLSSAALGFNATRRRDIAALRGVQRAIRILNFTYTELRGTTGRLRWSTYRTDLLDLLNSMALSLPVPEDALYFGAIDAGRTRIVRELFVLGLNEGEFPRQPDPDLFYSPAERRDSPLPLRRPIPAEDASLWWQVIGNTTSHLTLLRPRLDDKGNSTLASPYWQAVVSQIAGLTVHTPAVDAVPSAETALSMGEQLVAHAANGGDHLPQDAVRLWHNIARSDSVRRQRADRALDAGRYEGIVRQPALVADLHRRYGERKDWSVSQLHRYANCPYGFFAEYVLGIAPIEEPAEGFNPRQSGQIYHAILESLYGWMTQEYVTPSPETQPTLMERLDSICDEAFRTAPARYQFRPGALWQQEQKEMRRHLHALVAWECEEDRNRQPLEQERRFGDIANSNQESVAFSTDGITFRLHGVVDRVDQEGEKVHIVDYKSGNTKYEEDDIIGGRALQVALYALAMEQMDYQVASSRYLHIRKRVESGVLEFQGRVSDDSTVKSALTQVAAFVVDIREGRFPAAPADVTKTARACRDNCPFAVMCRVNRTSIEKGAAALEGVHG